MSQFSFELANTSHDGALRAVVREVSMPGEISISLCREPSFFLAERLGNVKSQTIICKDGLSGNVVGIGGRSTRTLYVDGLERNIGYLSMLRFLPVARSSNLLVRGYKYFRQLHADGDVPYYFTSILEDNSTARNILESGRAGLPMYTPIGTLVTYMIPLRKKGRRKKSCKYVNTCAEHLLPAAHDCIREWNSRYQLASSYSLADLGGKTSHLSGFSPENLYLHQKGGEVLGTLGVWDQESCKQTVVQKYSARLKLIRPLYNAVARLSGQVPLPSEGGCIRCVYACCISSRGDDSSVFQSVLSQACSDWSQKGYDYLLLGLCQGNKLESVAVTFSQRQLKSRIYLVHWKDEKVSLPQRPFLPHVEVATL